MNTRQHDIVNLVEKYGEISIKSLADTLNVSEMTIHRDLDFLQSERIVHKKRGAAEFIDGSVKNKTTFYLEEKRAIGKKAASLLNPGESVIFDNSTTAIECARFLDDDLKLTCYTTNLEVANIVSKANSHILYCSGGYYFPDTNGFIGQYAEQFISSVTADVAIIGASGISIENGITNPYPMHSVLQEKIIHNAKKCILIADHSKFDRTALEKNGELSDIDIIVTDSGISDDVLERYREYVEIIIA